MGIPRDERADPPDAWYVISFGECIPAMDCPKTLAGFARALMKGAPLLTLA